MAGFLGCFCSLVGNAGNEVFTQLCCCLLVTYLSSFPSLLLPPLLGLSLASRFCQSSVTNVRRLCSRGGPNLRLFCGCFSLFVIHFYLLVHIFWYGLCIDALFFFCFHFSYVKYLFYEVTVRLVNFESNYRSLVVVGTYSCLILDRSFFSIIVHIAEFDFYIWGQFDINWKTNENLGFRHAGQGGICLWLFGSYRDRRLWRKQVFWWQDFLEWWSIWQSF